MPTHARRHGHDTSKPDTRNLHRHAPGSNPNADEIRKAAGIPGCPDTPEGLNGPENANTEAGGGPGTPKPAPEVKTGHFGGERARLLELAAQWHAAGCVVHPAKADGSKVPMSVAGGGVELEPDVYAATYASGPRAGQPHATTASCVQTHHRGACMRLTRLGLRGQTVCGLGHALRQLPQPSLRLSANDAPTRGQFVRPRASALTACGINRPRGSQKLGSCTPGAETLPNE
jgi:hypothetical protein